MKVFLILALALVARAEPPVDSWGMQPPAVNAPDSSYGPPNQQFGTPLRSTGLTDARFTGFNSRGSQYSAPSMPASRYLPAARTAAARMPAQQYGAPSGFEGYPDARNAFDDDMSEPASYEYKYEVNDDASGSEYGHKESREGASTSGEYRVLLPDGRTQVVTYEADENGYRPQITYLEPAQQGGYPRGPSSGARGGPY